jgi:hypothetical protein
MTKLVVASVATKNCYKEFLLLKYSLEQYHSCQWYVSCDAFSHSQIKQFDNVDAKILIDSDDCDHNSSDPTQQENFLKVILTKFDICKIAIEKHGGVLFLDSDMLFVNPLEKKMLELFEIKSLDAILSQHMTNNWKNEAYHGYYNVGMFYLRNVDLIDKWKMMSVNHRSLNMYYEQKPLEFVQRNFITANFPIYYNVGWWRFNERDTLGRLDKLRLYDNIICFGTNKAVNFHLHLLKESQIHYGKFLMDRIFSMLGESGNKKYQALLQKFQDIKSD